MRGVITIIVIAVFGFFGFQLAVNDRSPADVFSGNSVQSVLTLENDTLVHHKADGTPGFLRGRCSSRTPSCGVSTSLGNVQWRPEHIREFDVPTPTDVWN